MKTTLFFSNKGQSVAFAPKDKKKLWEDDYVKTLVEKEKIVEVPEVEEKKQPEVKKKDDKSGKGKGKNSDEQSL